MADSVTPLMIVVKGGPKPQGSHDGIPIWKGGPCPVCRQRRFIRVAVIPRTTIALKGWRDAVTAAAKTTMEEAGLAPIKGPVTLSMTFSIARFTNQYRTGRFSHLLRDDAPCWHCQDPDLSKLARATEDALTDGGVWHDDNQVVEYARLAKAWTLESFHPGANAPVLPAAIQPWTLAGITDADVMAEPGCVIRVTRPMAWTPLAAADALPLEATT
jgi:Holliday junction resolvase RusA-like endonuclease